MLLSRIFFLTPGPPHPWHSPPLKQSPSSFLQTHQRFPSYCRVYLERRQTGRNRDETGYTHPHLFQWRSQQAAIDNRPGFALHGNLPSRTPLIVKAYLATGVRLGPQTGKVMPRVACDCHQPCGQSAFDSRRFR